VSAWTSPYELVLPGTTPDAVRLTLSRHHRQRTSSGLYVSVRGETVRANVRDNPRIRGNNAPWLKAVVEPDPRGSRITGTLQWANLVVNSWGGVVAGLFFVAVSVQALAHAGLPWFIVGWLILTLIGGAALVWYSVRRLRNDARERATYVRKLTEALAELIGTSPG